MGIIDVASTLTQLPGLLKLKKGMVPREAHVADCFGARVQANADRIADLTAILFEGQSITWSEFNALANRYANYMTGEGIVRGDVVSVMMENRIEYLALLVGLNKLGAIASLINSNLHGKSLGHCISVTKSKKCVFGSEVTPAIEGVKTELDLAEGEDYYVLPDGENTSGINWAKDLSVSSKDCSSSNPETTQTTTIGETALFVFTSGTTGLPKAAVMSNRRFLMAADMVSQAGLKCTEKDRLYICLPLYHATGLMIGVGSAFASGASMFIRRKFSASQFLPEVRQYQCNCFIYIGELCRYLANTPVKTDDANNPIRAMIGNGMRPDVWMGFKNRFKVQRIIEFYGASEGNVSFANLLNKDCTVGMTSAKVALVKYDVHRDEIVRDENGFCIEVDEGEPGLLLGKITEDTVFEGYTDAAATEKKVVRDALEKGDAWFNSGDLMRTVDVGFTLGYPHYQFVDRIGDTFRWKSENVSTNEVGEIINGFEQIKLCNVYGVEVPGTDGRAGMAAITLSDGNTEFDLAAFTEYVTKELPSYAIPVFLRIQPEIDVTGTFKMVKGDLRKEAYNIRSFEDRVFVRLPSSKSYELLDAGLLDKIKAAELQF
ncbi:MAG: long-chain-acyl-CoA synthetase [Gammaproteobacteria bacterium]|jgi:citronellyl-CoA synthetase|nr:long-chain-acyl-CoA synthetase [Gammaproteobacteria bacterium]MCH1551759.1 long-chain-acyl-CoA synthetase [Pseudomonadales bacterium]